MHGPHRSHCASDKARFACLLAAAALAVATLCELRAAEAPMADVVLVGGTIFDGTGNDGFQGDVAIRAGRIVAVGQFTGAAGQRIDCRGLVVCPGCIDLHNHSDRQVTDPLTRGVVNYLTQGCTTIVTGNCGAGPIKVQEYYDAIDAAGAGANVAHLLPQGDLRDVVIGKALRKATADEIARMRQLTEVAMRDGAWGMSTGLIYVPSSYADSDELAEIAEVVGEHGGIYASHIRDEGTGLVGALREAIEIGRRGKTPVHISHFKSSGPEAWGLIRQGAALIEQSRGEGLRVTADQYPYIASSTSLEAMLIPTWARAGGNDALKERLSNSEQLARIREAIGEELHTRGDRAPIRIARYQPHPDWAGKSLQEIADAEKRDPIDLTIEIARNGGAAAVSFGMSEEDVRYAMQLPWVATASDGRAMIPDADKPHPRSYGTFSRKIGYYSIAEQVLPLAQAIRSSTGLPADILGLTDRGYLRPELAADVLVFDPQTFRDRATFTDPHQYSAGVRYVFVNGQPAVFAGTPTGALAGKALRKRVAREEKAGS